MPTNLLTNFSLIASLFIRAGCHSTPSGMHTKHPSSCFPSFSRRHASLINPLQQLHSRNFSSSLFVSFSTNSSTLHPLYLPSSLLYTNPSISSEYGISSTGSVAILYSRVLKCVWYINFCSYFLISTNNPVPLNLSILPFKLIS